MLRIFRQFITATTQLSGPRRMNKRPKRHSTWAGLSASHVAPHRRH